MFDGAMFDMDSILGDKAEWDAALEREQKMRDRKAVTSQAGESFRHLIRRFDPPLKAEYMDLYKEWLIRHSPDSSSWSDEMIPTQRGEYLEEGLVFPIPFGHNWMVMCDEFVNETYGNAQPCVRSALASVLKSIRGMFKHKSCNARSKRTKAVEQGMRTCPKTLDEAWRGDDAVEWLAAADLEFNTLTELGVVDHNYTLDQLQRAGMKTAPINMSVVLDNKYGKDNELAGGDRHDQSS